MSLYSGSKGPSHSDVGGRGRLLLSLCRQNQNEKENLDSEPNNPASRTIDNVSVWNPFIFEYDRFSTIITDKDLAILCEKFTQISPCSNKNTLARFEPTNNAEETIENLDNESTISDIVEPFGDDDSIKDPDFDVSDYVTSPDSVEMDEANMNQSTKKQAKEIRQSQESRLKQNHQICPAAEVLVDVNNFSPENEGGTTTKRGKKRVACPSEWKSNKNKQLRNSGKEYTSRKSNKIVKARVIKPPCRNCPHNCPLKISEEIRMSLFNRYWELGSIEKQRDFVVRHSAEVKPQYPQISLPPAFIPNDQRRDPYNNDGRGFSSSTHFPPYSSTPYPPRDFAYNPNDPRNDYNQNFGQRPSDLPPSFVPKTNVNSPQNFNNRQGDFSAQRPINPQNFGGRSFDDDFNRRNRVDGDIRGLLQALDIQASQMCTNNVAAQWNFETNINEATQLEAINAQQFYSEFQHGVWELLSKVGNINSLDPQTFRQIRYYSVIGPSALPPEELDRYNRLINDMLVLYNTGSICAFNDPLHCGLRLQPDLSKIMAKSRNWDELQYVWTEWRRNSGQKMKDAYEQMVKVSNNAARANNLEDAWEEVKPLYELLLTYVRRKLREYYGPEKINRQAPLPAHILGNMWGQSWTNILDITQPYPGQSFLDVTPEMIKQGYTPPDLFRLAEDFFVSLNMSVLPLEFWQGSVLQEPLDRIVLCQPSAWDFCNRRDFSEKYQGIKPPVLRSEIDFDPGSKYHIPANIPYLR
ncbi:unnamed protein product [Diabrotica balteata]|uniref:Angiotensin-converting enzyme n=1 Tax=Diabrotica balteata TaxID=107213 RepID=A0A9N9STS3_DIABA|nr:unnamed protein product [Diabrotica balteata]